MTYTNDLPPWTPNVQDVANHLLARTRIANGTLAGVFNSQTTPTDVQVGLIINQQVQLLAPRLGEVPERLYDAACALAALKVAVEVEQSYFMEQVASGMSPHRALTADFMASMRSWDALATGDVPSGVRTASLPVGTLYPGYATGTY